MMKSSAKHSPTKHSSRRYLPGLRSPVSKERVPCMHNIGGDVSCWRYSDSPVCEGCFVVGSFENCHCNDVRENCPFCISTQKKTTFCNQNTLMGNMRVPFHRRTQYSPFAKMAIGKAAKGYVPCTSTQTFPAEEANINVCFKKAGHSMCSKHSEIQKLTSLGYMECNLKCKSQNIVNFTFVTGTRVSIHSVQQQAGMLCQEIADPCIEICRNCSTVMGHLGIWDHIMQEIGSPEQIFTMLDDFSAGKPDHGFVYDPSVIPTIHAIRACLEESPHSVVLPTLLSPISASGKEKYCMSDSDSIFEDEVSSTCDEHINMEF